MQLAIYVRLSPMPMRLPEVVRLATPRTVLGSHFAPHRRTLSAVPEARPGPPSVPAAIVMRRAVGLHAWLGLAFVVPIISEAMVFVSDGSRAWTLRQRWDAVRRFATPLIAEASWFVPVALALIATAYAWNYAIVPGVPARNERDEHNAAVALARGVAALMVTFSAFSAIGIQRPVDQLAPVILIVACTAICSLLAARLERFYRADLRQMALLAAQRVEADNVSLHRLQAPAWSRLKTASIAGAHVACCWAALASVNLLDARARHASRAGWLHQTNITTALWIVPVMALALSWSYFGWRQGVRLLQVMITAALGVFPVAFIVAGIDRIYAPAPSAHLVGVSTCFVAAGGLAAAVPLWRSGPRRRRIAPFTVSRLGDALAAAITRRQLARHEVQAAVAAQEALDTSFDGESAPAP